MTTEKTAITRRRFVAGGVASGAAATVPGVSQATTLRAPGVAGTASADVVVVGAGLAGLTAARAVRKAGRSVIVLEARERVGGRCFSRSLGAGASDVANMGATFVGPTQHRIQALMSELKIGRFPTYARTARARRTRARSRRAATRPL